MLNNELTSKTGLQGNCSTQPAAAAQRASTSADSPRRNISLADSDGSIGQKMPRGLRLPLKSLRAILTEIRDSQDLAQAVERANEGLGIVDGLIERC